MNIYVINLSAATVSTPNITLNGVMSDSINSTGFSFTFNAVAAPTDIFNWVILKAIQNWNGGIPTGSTAFQFGVDKVYVANFGNGAVGPYSKLEIIA